MQLIQFQLVFHEAGTRERKMTTVATAFAFAFAYSIFGLGLGWHGTNAGTVGFGLGLGLAGVTWAGTARHDEMTGPSRHGTK